MMFKHPHVVIVGAGIVGASLAYHLACKHARVTLIDKAPKPATEITAKSFAWITAGHDAPGIYLTLRQQAIADWRRIEDEFNGRLIVNWPGALTWHAATAETERIVRDALHTGYAVRCVEAQEIRLLEPRLKHVPALAMFAKQEGAIDPVLTTELFISAAREWGANIHLDNTVLALMTSGERITGVVTANGNIMADIVVLAAAAATATLCQPLGIILPIQVSPAILLGFRNNNRFVNRIISNPCMEIRAASNTLTLAAAEYIDESTENNPQVIAQRVAEKIKNHWQGTEQIKLTKVVAGKRPVPQDGPPIIGRATGIKGLYVSVMHAGVTLAAVAGRLAAAEICSDQDDSLLSAYRPNRFANLK